MEMREKVRSKKGKEKRDKRRGREWSQSLKRASWRFVDHVRSLTNSRVIYNSTLQDFGPYLLPNFLSLFILYIIYIIF